MTVKELGQRMDVDEFMYWVVRDEIHVSEAWEQSALLRLSIAQISGAKGARYDDFLPPRRRLGPEPNDLAGRFLAQVRVHNALMISAGRA